MYPRSRISTHRKGADPTGTALMRSTFKFLIHFLLTVIVTSAWNKPATILPKQFALQEGDTPCYICAAEWKYRRRNSAIKMEDELRLLEDDERCCAAKVIHDVEKELEAMNPIQWENTAIDGEILKRHTDEMLDATKTGRFSMQEYKKQVNMLEERWNKYRTQQDFNKWTALRYWLRIRGIRQRIEAIDKDIRGETSRRSRRLQKRVRKAEKLMEQTKNKLRELYAVYHREGKSRFSECNLKRRIELAINRNNAENQRRLRFTTPATHLSWQSTRRWNSWKVQSSNH